MAGKRQKNPMRKQTTRKRANPAIDATDLANRESILNTLETISKYPRKPAEFFTQRCTEISISKAGVIELRMAFSGLTSQTHLPKDLVDLCAAYSVETEEVMVKRTIEQFQFFADRTVVNRIRKHSPPSLRPRFTRLIGSLDRRQPAYLWWFSMRSSLPSFIPMGDVRMARYDYPPYCFYLWNEDGQKIASIFFRECFVAGFPHWDPKYACFAWNKSLIDAVPYPDLIAPCLKTSTVTLEQLKTCAIALESYTRNIQNDAWLPKLFDLFKGLTAMKLWISSVNTFEHMEDAKGAQMESCLEWNRFCAEYHFGDPLPVVTKTSEGGEEMKK